MCNGFLFAIAAWLILCDRDNDTGCGCGGNSRPGGCQTNNTTSGCGCGGETPVERRGIDNQPQQTDDAGGYEIINV